MSFALLLPWLLFAAAIAMGAVLVVRVRALAAELAAAEAKRQEVEDKAETSRQQLDKAVAKQQRSSEELAQARRKLEQTRKRAARTGDAARPAASSHTQNSETALETARQERNAARDEASALAVDLAKTRAALEASKQARPLLDNAAIEALQVRAETGDAQQKQLRNELTAVQANEKRLREKLDTQQQLYVSIRGELEAKKDRLRTQNEEIERLRALRVVLQEDEPSS